MNQSSSILVVGEADREYKSSDPKLINALMAMNHRPVRIEGLEGRLTYFFDTDKVQEDINRIMTNEEITVSLRSVWSAQQVWAMNLHRVRRDYS